MAGLTLQHLYDAGAERVAASAQAWLGLAEDLDNTTENLIRGSRELEDVWPAGAAAQAAHRRVAELRAEAGHAYQPCRRIGEALREHADTLRSLQQLLREITAEAAGRGFDVDIATGAVRAPQHVDAGTTAPHVVAQQVNAYVHQLQGVLDRAADLDRRTSAVLAANLPDVQHGFGSLSAPVLAESTIRAQQGRPPQQVHDWWLSLDPEQQEQALADYPALVGALDGVPATDRDTANRTVLERDVTALTERRAAVDDRQRYLLDMADQGRLQEVYPGSMNPVGAAMSELDGLKDQRTGIDGMLAGAADIRDRLADPSQPPAFLLGFSTAGDGRAIVSVGNPDASDNVVTYVPGTMSDLPGVAGDLQRADTMAEDAADYDPSGRSTAAILWLGYDAPDMFGNAGSSSYADHAVDGLQNFQSGLRATHTEGVSHNTVIGHSYGSTTVGYAARDGDGLAANDLIFVGSPGVGVNSAAELHLQGDASNVWGSTAKNDVIHLTGPPGMSDVKRFGEDPSGAGFGGRTFTTADGRWGPVDSVATHSAYWDQDNPSRRAIAYIITGQTTKVD
jgi:hypothetical protein